MNIDAHKEYEAFNKSAILDALKKYQIETVSIRYEGGVIPVELRKFSSLLS